jgi:hypothetical protein
MQRNVFAYVDDIVVVSTKKTTQIDDLAETFANMRRAQLKLNSKKCVSGEQKGKVLGCLLFVKGIEANQDKINAIIHMKPPTVQKRSSKTNRQKCSAESVHVQTSGTKPTISHSTQGLWQFSVGARIAGSFRQTQRSHKKVAHSSKSVAKSTTHRIRLHHAHSGKKSPRARKEICKEGRKLSKQVPIYFISEALADSKKYYSEMEKICYTIVMSARKLRHYFKAHRVRVLTNQPPNDIFRNQDCSGRIGKWAMELSEHVIDFDKRSAIKSQVLVDFIAGWTEPSSYIEGLVIDTPWQLYYDGAWGSFGVRAAAILISPSGIKLRYAAHL